jgi:hypothetical protein
MSKAPWVPLPGARPTLIELFLLLGGYALSLWLAQVNKMKDTAGEDILVQSFGNALPFLMLRLTEGIVLLLPLFWILQIIEGRRQWLAAGEWLGLFAWFGTFLVTIEGICQYADLLPQRLRELAAWPLILWYLVVVPAMALVALLLAVLGLFSRKQQPWTHRLGLALMMWPVVPLVVMVIAGQWPRAG